MANYREPQWLLPNEKNLAMPASDATVGSGLAEDRHSLYSMDFDGTGQKIEASTLSITGDWSISMWVNTDTTSYQTALQLSSQATTGTQDSIIFVRNTYESNKWGFYDGSTTLLGSVLDTNRWYNLVLTKNGTTYTIFLNGTQEGQSTKLNINITDLLIGRRSYNGFYFNGEIDEVAIWNRTLSASEITTLYNSGAPGNLMALSNKPMAYYPLGEQARRGSEWQFPNEVLQSQVFDFDATDYINVSPILPLQGLSSFSISSWVYWDGHGGGSDQWIFMHANAGNTKRIQVEIYGSDLYFQILGTGGGYVRVDMPQGRWVNLLCVFNSSEAAADRMIVYIDGDRAPDVVYVAPTLTTTDTDYTYSMIGARNDGYYFDGKMSNVAIWNSDQSANITNIYNNGSPQSSYTTTPTAWYKLNATSNYAGLNPNWHNALDFNGSSNWIDCGAGFQYSDLTISGWFYADSISTFERIIQLGRSSGGIGFGVGWDNSSKLIAWWNDGTETVRLGNTSLSTGKWYHFAMTRDSSEVKIYVNGVDDSGTGGQTGWGSTNNNLELGRKAGGGQYMDGKLSNVAIYNQVISAEDIKYLYNGGTPQTSLSFEPTSWWKLDNLTTGIQDSGSASNNGTNNGATEVASNVAVNQWNFDNVSQAQTPNWSSALDFSGSNQWIDCGVDSSIDTGDLSVAFWFNKDSSASGFQYVFNSGSGSAKAGFVFAFSGTNIYIGRKTLTHTAAFTTYTNIGISADKWHHIALTYNDTSNNFIAYLDGQSVHNSTGTTATNAASSEIIFGRISNVASSYYKGKINNAAIFNTELDASAILTLYNSGQPETAISSSPVSWWKLNNTTTGIQDSGSASNNGTNNGTTETQTNVWTPRLNGESTTLPSTALVSSDLQFESPYSNFSLDFDGTNDYVDCTDNDMFSFGNGTTDSPFSLSAWIKIDVASNFRLISKYQGSDYEYQFDIGGGGYLQLYLFDGASAWRARYQNSTLNTGQWYHVAATYNGVGGTDAQDGIKIYVDGIRVDDTTVSSGAYTAMSNTNAPLNIARLDSNYANGKIDETAVFNKELTQAEVSSIYNNGYPADLTSLSPVSWWRLGEDAYFVSPNFTVPNQITGAPNGTSQNMDQADLVADAPGSYASGIGNSLALADRVGDAPESTANSLSFNMTPLNKISYPSGYVPTQADNVYSMAFDGVSDYVSAANTFLNSATVCSISFWGKKDASNKELVVGGRIDTNNGIWIQWYIDGNIYFSPRGSGAGSYTLTHAQSYDSNWHHYVGVYDGSSAANCKLYLDGNLVATGTGTPPASLPATTGDVFQIGALGTSFYTTGNIDEVAIFDYALSARQIKQDIYEGTTTGKTADLNNISNLTAPVAWYRMGD